MRCCDSMRSNDMRLVSQLFRRQYSLAARAQLRGLGISARQEQARVVRGEWERPTPKVVRLAGSASSPEQDLMNVLLEVAPSAIASHGSAAWLWGLLPVPERHEVTVPTGVRWRAGRFVVHRLSGIAPAVVFRGGFPVTNPLRALIDLAASAGAPELDDAVDRAIATRLVSMDAIEAELARVGARGRDGAGAMRASLRRRGLREGPRPSVLEARLHRLLRTGGLTPLSVEAVFGEDRRYRLDALLDPRVAVEVDGHVHHSTPEQKAYDERRRNEIRMSGVFLLVYDWRAVIHDGRRVLAECHQALARYGSGPVRRLAN